ncbi:MAG: hypothetical protein AAFO82_12890, partial [Bacteroidota bacterium]
MKNTCFLFLLSLFPLLLFSQTLSTKEWQADLAFLQKTVHQDYSFLFRKVSAKDFDAAVEKLNQEIPSLEQYQIITRMSELVACFGYGHTFMSMDAETVNFHQTPINLYQFKDGIYIEGAHKNYAKSVGAKVLEVEGMPVEKALEKIRSVVPAENEQYFRAYSGYYLTRPEILHTKGITTEFSPNITLTLEKDGQQFEQTFQAKRDAKFSTHYNLSQV